MRPRRKRPHKPLLFTLGSLADRWASIVVRSHYEFRIDPSIPSTDRAAADGQQLSARSWAIPMLLGGTNAMASCTKTQPFPSTLASSAPASK